MSLATHVQERAAEYGATASVSTAVISFTAEHLPVVQFIAGLVSIVSAVLASAWVLYKFYRSLRGNDTKDEA